VLAGIADGWLAVWQPYVAPAAVIAFALTFRLARVSLAAGLVAALVTMYVAPALLFLALGISDYQFTLVWLALFAGPVIARARLDRWHIPGWYGVLFAAWALLIALSWPIVAGREIDFSIAAARTLDSTTATFQGAPPMAAAWIAITALAQMLGILWLDLLWAEFAGESLTRFVRVVAIPIVVSAVAGGLATIYQGTIDLNWMNTEFWARLGRAGGLMLDANTAGITGALWAPVAALLIWHRQLPVWAGVVIYAVLAGATWESGSRTALVALGVGTLGILVGALQRRGWWQPRMGPIVLLVGGAALLLAMFIAPRGGQSPSPLQRVFDRLPRPEAEDMSRFADEMWTRFGYGTAAASIARDHPLTGVGIGAFHVVFNDYLHRETGETLPPDNAQNWWRHQIAELGVAGAVPSIAISALLIALIWNGGTYAEPFGSTTVLRLMLTGVGLASLLGVPTQHPATWISFVTLLFWLLALYLRTDAKPNVVAPGWWTAALVLALAVAVGQAISARGNLRVPERALWTGAAFRYGFAPPEGISQYGDLRWMGRHAVQVLPVERRWLQLALWPPSSKLSAGPSLDVWVNGRHIIRDAPITAAPVIYYIQTPESREWVMVELDVSEAIDDDRALAIAMDWFHAPPAGTPAERTIR
jgi:hypothetical protein